MKIANNILELIGKTPMVQIQKMKFENEATILLKLESFNPGGSVKDRLAYAMISDAEQRGLITPTTTIIEPTSGNTGVGLAMVCAVKGYKLILTMPESMSIERRNLVKAYGAEVVLTDAKKGMKGAIEKAEEIKSQLKNSYIPMQFENLSNPQIHRLTTAKEIWHDTEGNIDIFVSGVGTGGTITGVSEVLKQKNKDIKCYAVEPEDSSVLSGGNPAPHKIQGIGAGFIPAILNTTIYDAVIKVSNTDAFAKAKYLAQREGILCGISSGAIFHAAVELAQKPENAKKTIVAMVCDTGERYLSTELFS
ncbi:MAG: cysteine synthase A [Bacteroidetes bacterium GWF2_33_38]|nr:MAG: cysteine synthase A [Bacteroidetes bacterium GWF2_33_38]OFY75213.1 MAG: cysteine synthase A [Bacteroidetes bacterium RIFOXYA12_FULL_33_9]OFY91610.1 MAG: cysteine synthase A [Bacteroidetes bacterium RIFOXYA2_FULL_33_7]HBX52585.1 cysteine synthase A [Bacteroidales bacterium]